MSPRVGLLVSAAVMALVATSARGVPRADSSEEPPILLERNMYDTERYNPESYSQFFADHRTMRTPVEGTVARDRYEDDPEVRDGPGRPTGSGYVLTVPQPVIAAGGRLSRRCSRAARSASASTARPATARPATARAWWSASATR